MNKLAILTVAASLAMAGTVRAAEVEVKLLNKGTDGGTMAFEPAFVKIASGDTVKLLSTDKGHDPESIKGILPGAKPLVSKGSEAIAVRFEQEGVYSVKCLPHHGICMVVMVGASANVVQAKAVSHVGKAKQAAGKMASK